jgi:hypothetical protein
MTKQIAVQFSYFGYTASFQTSAPSVAERRAEANALILNKFGSAPALRYVEPGLPFPDYVPMLTWDSELQEFN